MCAIRFFRGQVLKLDTSALRIPPRKREQRLPEILTMEEARRLVDAHPKLKYRAALTTIYGCGLRVGECAALRVQDIDNEQMRLRVNQGKGKKDRYTILPRAALEVLRVPRPIYERTPPAPKEEGTRVHGQLAVFAEDARWQALEDQAFAKDWVVYAKRPFGGPGAVLAYLGRYTHRVAISNARIQEVTDQTVRFAYRDRKDASKQKEMTLAGTEFLRRFFLHTLPSGFTRIRHYGYLGNSVREQRLPVIRSLIGQEDPPETETSPHERLEKHHGIRLRACPCCKTGEMLPVKPLPRIHDPPR